MNGTGCRPREIIPNSPTNTATARRPKTTATTFMAAFRSCFTARRFNNSATTPVTTARPTPHSAATRSSTTVGNSPATATPTTATPAASPAWEPKGSFSSPCPVTSASPVGPSPGGIRRSPRRYPAGSTPGAATAPFPASCPASSRPARPPPPRPPASTPPRRRARPPSCGEPSTPARCRPNRPSLGVPAPPFGRLPKPWETLGFPTPPRSNPFTRGRRLTPNERHVQPLQCPGTGLRQRGLGHPVAQLSPPERQPPFSRGTPRARPLRLRGARRSSGRDVAHPRPGVRVASLLLSRFSEDPMPKPLVLTSPRFKDGVLALAGEGDGDEVPVLEAGGRHPHRLHRRGRGHRPTPALGEPARRDEEPGSHRRGPGRPGPQAPAAHLLPPGPLQHPPGRPGAAGGGPDGRAAPRDAGGAQRLRPPGVRGPHAACRPAPVLLPAVRAGRGAAEPEPTHADGFVEGHGGPHPGPGGPHRPVREGPPPGLRAGPGPVGLRRLESRHA